MKKRIIAERYASALLGVTRKTGEMEKVFDELTFLKKIIAANSFLKRFLESPHITQEDKTALIRKVLSPVLTGTTVNLLLLLIRRYRLLYLSEIIEEYQRLYDIAMDIQRADVITTYPLDDMQVQKLHQTIERILKKNIKMNFHLDPGILGGVIVKTPNIIIDGSVRKQLKDLEHALTSLRV